MINKETRSIKLSGEQLFDIWAFVICSAISSKHGTISKIETIAILDMAKNWAKHNKVEIGTAHHIVELLLAELKNWDQLIIKTRDAIELIGHRSLDQLKEDVQRVNNAD